MFFISYILVFFFLSLPIPPRSSPSGYPPSFIIFFISFQNTNKQQEKKSPNQEITNPPKKILKQKQKSKQISKWPSRQKCSNKAKHNKKSTKNLFCVGQLLGMGLALQGGCPEAGHHWRKLIFPLPLNVNMISKPEFYQPSNSSKVYDVLDVLLTMGPNFSSSGCWTVMVTVLTYKMGVTFRTFLLY